MYMFIHIRRCIIYYSMLWLYQKVKIMMDTSHFQFGVIILKTTMNTWDIHTRFTLKYTRKDICRRNSLNQDWQNVEVGWMQIHCITSLLLCMLDNFHNNTFATLISSLALLFSLECFKINRRYHVISPINT